jgi:glycosyltransferase involved in cell wall biosynthesis
MKIWLINPYGPIPIPSEDWREYRFTIIGNYLASLGHEVVWYTSSFSHHFKKQRSDGWKDFEVNTNFKIRLVPTPGYESNISFGRIYRDLVFSSKVYKERKLQVEKPDFIIYSESPLSFGYGGYKLAKYYKIPVVFDQMDLWPELIINAFPSTIRKIINLMFYPVFLSRKYIYNNLDGFISLSEPYMSIPLEIAPSLKNKPHEVIYNGIDVIKFRESRGDNNELIRLLLQKKENEIWFVFAGTLGPSYDILNLLKVASLIIKDNNKSVKFILAGDGPLKKEVNDFIRYNSGEVVSYLGQLKPDFLVDLYKYCDVGLSTYTVVSNVEMPDKFYDYTAAGLPIVNSLKGEVGRVIQNQNIGFNYKAGNSRELYDVITKISNDKEMREKMAKNSFESGLVYDKNNQIQKLGNLINKIFKRDFITI